eukprot:scaffold17271_cov170-Skeletonema_dohrnii-CCMP3373.AAC.3
MIGDEMHWIVINLSRLSITYIQSSLSDPTTIHAFRVDTDRHVVRSSINFEVIGVHVQLQQALTFTQALLPPSIFNT